MLGKAKKPPKKGHKPPPKKDKKGKLTIQPVGGPWLPKKAKKPRK